MLSCKDLEIPNRLRQNDRELIPHFKNEEYLYRWFKPDVEFFNGKISNAAVGKVFQPPYDISVNRSSLCEQPTDVLYNPFNLPHRFNHGVIQVKVDSVNNYSFKSIEGSQNEEVQITIRLGIEHKPEVCMYPHSQIIVYKNDSRVEKEIKNKTLKAAIRDELRLLFSVCYEPNSDFKP